MSSPIHGCVFIPGIVREIQVALPPKTDLVGVFTTYPDARQVERDGFNLPYDTRIEHTSLEPTCYFLYWNDDAFQNDLASFLGLTPGELQMATVTIEVIEAPEPMDFVTIEVIEAPEPMDFVTIKTEDQT